MLFVFQRHVYVYVLICVCIYLLLYALILESSNILQNHLKNGPTRKHILNFGRISINTLLFGRNRLINKKRVHYQYKQRHSE